MAHSQTSSFADDYYTSSYDSTFHPSAPQPKPPAVRKQASLAQISVPSFSAFRSNTPQPSQVSSIPVLSPSVAKRKPGPFLPAHSPRAASFSLAEKASPRLAEPKSRPLSLESTLPQQPNGLETTLSPPLTEEFTARQEDRSSYAFPASTHERNESIDARLAGLDTASSTYSNSRRSSIPIHARYAREHIQSHAPRQSVSSIAFSDYSSAAKNEQRDSMHQQGPSMTLQLDGEQRPLSDDSQLSESPRSREQRPKSPGGRLGQFFGWKSSPGPSGTESPTTTFSERSLSPLPSPQKRLPTVPMDGSGSNARLTPAGLDIHKANSVAHHYYDHPDTPILLGSPETNAHVRELEQELTQVSTELASSIRREMDLEDELDRARAELQAMPQHEITRRSSDYFSDSGASSTRYPVSDPDARLEQMEQTLRKVEQEKAQIKVDMASRLQSELARRRDLERVVQDLEAELERSFNEGADRSGVESRMTELESSLDETRRRLSQERQEKDSVHDLYNATRLDLEQHKNERDNLRDEVVPHLKARLEGLEGEAADTQALMYENTRMQQEMLALREELQKYQSQGAGSRFTSIAEEGNDSGMAELRGGLSRSNSLARTRGTRGASVTRSGSVKERSEGSRQRSGSVGGHALSVEGVKEIEDQRDALHKALKLLISRHEKQQREHQRAVKKLTSARDHAEQSTPKRTAYHREVSTLKEEVTTLRKRTEDALEQKWQYEKGLSGLKMDLDRAEQEMRGLKSILQENNMLGSNRHSLLSAYESDDSSEETMKLSISEAESERDQARQIAQEYRQRAMSSQEPSSEELMSSARRMDELADQLERHVQSHVRLRERLAEAVAKGEKEQKESTRQIEEMQKRLAGMEDSVLAAQQHSETTLDNHEAEVRRINEATSPALQRLRISIPDPKKLSPTSPLAVKSPRFSTKLSDTSLLEMSRTQMLERKVRELEGLLREAEEDMQSVVQRVQSSQMEVAELQTERDAAMTQMRKLQRLIVEEREKADLLLEQGSR